MQTKIDEWRSNTEQSDWSYEYKGSGVSAMISGSQMRAARALLGMDQKTLAKRSGLSVLTIQRMEAAEGGVLGAVDAQQKVIRAFRKAGIELIGNHERSDRGGRGVRQAHPVGEAGLTH